MPLQHGGLALKNKDQFEGTTNTEKYAKAFTYMIQNASEIKCISYRSLVGYIFIIKIEPNDAVFLNLDSANKYTIPVTNILVKFALITPTKKEYADGTKITINNEDFEKEKNIQLDIYRKTIQRNTPICPSIIYYDVIPNTANSELLTIFSNKREVKNSKTQMITRDILFYKNNKSVNVGIIGMEYANGYTTFNNYLDDITRDQTIRIYNSRECGDNCRCIANIIINIIRLFISTGIIHMDLHTNNIMVNVNENKSLLIDFGFYNKLIDTEECNEDVRVSDNSIIYKRVIKGHVFGSKTEDIKSVDAIVKYLKLQLGESYDKIEDEQGFMQLYLFGMSDEMRIKKIMKLFILIIMCDLNLNELRLGRPIIMMRDFLDFLGFDIRTTNEGDFFSKKKIDDINNDKKPVDDWISENIKKNDKTFYYNIFFKKIFTEVFTKIKQMYAINDDSINRIGIDEETDKHNQKRNDEYTYGKTTIGSKESKESKELKKRNRKLYTDPEKPKNKQPTNKQPENNQPEKQPENKQPENNQPENNQPENKQPEDWNIFSFFTNLKGGNQTKYKRKKNSKIKKHKKNKRTKKNNKTKKNV